MHSSLFRLAILLLSCAACPAQVQGLRNLWLDNHGGGTVAFAPNGQSLASAGFGLSILSAQTGQQLRAIPMASYAMSSAFSPDGTLIALASLTDVTIQPVATGAAIVVPANNPGNPQGIAFTPDSQFLIAPLDPSRAALLRASNGAVVRTFAVPRLLQCLALDPSGTRLAIADAATGGQLPAVHLFDVTTGTRLPTLFSTVLTTLTSLAFAPSGARLACSGSTGSLVQELDVATGGVRAAYDARTFTGIHDLKYTPNGAWLVASGEVSASGRVEFWSTTTPTQVTALLALERAMKISFSPDGELLAGVGWSAHRSRAGVFDNPMQSADPWLARFASYGQSCHPMLNLDSNPPILGAGYLVRVTMPAPNQGGVLLFGVSASQLGGLVLPLDLTGFGMPGCALLQSMDLAEALPPPNGGVSQWLTNLPLDVTLIGSRFFTQATVLSSTSNPLGVVTSNGGANTLGL